MAGVTSRTVITRRAFARLGLSLLVGAGISPWVLGAGKTPVVRATEANLLRLAMLHLNPQLGQLDENRALIERAMRTAAAQGAKWLITPELALTGYRFDTVIGVDWISHGPDKWTRNLQNVAAELGVHLFLGHLEKPVAQEHCFNTTFVIDNQGEIIGRHQKINTIPIAEGWSKPGTLPIPIQVGHYKVGVLICADAWPAVHAKALQCQGADLIVSPAIWPPGEYGPGDSWEKRSLETGLPLFVCNRTGVERDFDMRQGQSVVAWDGERLVTHRSEDSTIFFVDWLHTEKAVINYQSINLTPLSL